MPVWDVRRFESIDSTNSYLMDQARSGAPEGLVAVAGTQGGGRGRLDRSWTAPAGTSLLISVLLRPTVSPEQIHMVTAVTALATLDTCRQFSGAPIDLKWPNDVVCSTKKLAGILVEADWPAGIGTENPAVVAGIGLNVNWPPDMGGQDFSEGATSLNLLVDGNKSGGGNPRIDITEVEGCLLDCLDRRYRNLFEDGGPRNQMSQYRKNLGTLGRAVRVTTSDGDFDGVALDVDDSGHLLVDTSTCIRSVIAGDVVHLRTR